VAVRRVGTQLNEVWEDGEAFAQLEERMKKIAEQKKDAEERRRAIKRKLPPPGASAETGSNNNNNTKDTADRNSMNNNNNNNNNTKQISDVHREFALSEEVHKTRVNQLRREEEAISREREVLEREKLALAREIKRTRDEDDSRFNDFPMLGGQEPGCERYVLTNLLGRGGFSEVYRAWDCHEMKEVACKLHSLNPRWSEERKRAYVRHAARECSIHKSLKHDHVVKLLDVFEVDSDTFCTVLELCEGDDLDARLKNTGSMSEREARAIVAQIFAGLAYCHGDTKRVIHYDLKPGNILFDNSGRVKITDFGLSKVMESRENIGSNNDFTSVELTSQGAGTYWYLPPECFETGPAPPKISSKVDVWSVGVIFYQMVYGKRPFGHEQTQEQILQAGTIRDAKKVEFPQKPALSNEAKEFICKCLSYRQSERPDVLQAALDPYVQFGGATNNGGGK
jgi:tousled-like kinase